MALSCGAGADAGPRERATQQGVRVSACAGTCVCVCVCMGVYAGTCMWELPGCFLQDGTRARPLGKPASGPTQRCPIRRLQAHTPWSSPPPRPGARACRVPQTEGAGPWGPPSGGDRLTPGPALTRGQVTETLGRDRGLPGPESRAQACPSAAPGARWLVLSRAKSLGSPPPSAESSGRAGVGPKSGPWGI